LPPLSSVLTLAALVVCVLFIVEKSNVITTNDARTNGFRELTSVIGGGEMMFALIRWYDALVVAAISYGFVRLSVQVLNRLYLTKRVGMIFGFGAIGLVFSGYSILMAVGLGGTLISVGFFIGIISASVARVLTDRQEQLLPAAITANSKREVRRPRETDREASDALEAEITSTRAKSNSDETSETKSTPAEKSRSSGSFVRIVRLTKTQQQLLAEALHRGDIDALSTSRYFSQGVGDSLVLGRGALNEVRMIVKTAIDKSSTTGAEVSLLQLQEQIDKEIASFDL